MFLLATALTAAAATLARAEEPASARVVAPPSEAPPSVSPLAGAGWMTAPAPPLADPLPAARVPIARRWWFWASLGAAAVAVVIAGFTLKPGQPYSGNSGVVSLP